MSKVDAQRAMREAKYARNKANASSSPGAVKPAAEPTTKPTTAKPVTKKDRTAEIAAVPQTGERCGHKSMNGRACTREANHPEKSHRYG